MGLGHDSVRASRTSLASAAVRAPPCLAMTAEATLAPQRPMLDGSMPDSQP